MAVFPKDHPMSLSTADQATTRPPYAAWLRSTNNITQQFLSLGSKPDVISMAGGLPASEFYPVAAVEEATRAALARWGSQALEYGAVEGFPALRDAIAARISGATGGLFTRENILLTTGSMQGLDLIGKVLLDPGDLVVAQFPTYLGALDAWRPRGPRYAKLDWTLTAPGFEETLREAKFVYAVPNYSNPTGVLVPQHERRALLDKVVAAGTWLVEDDPYLPLQLDGAAGASILAHDRARHGADRYDGSVLYLGTLSKSLVPGLRVGWVVAEPKIIQMLALAKQSTDLSSSMFAQSVALALIEGTVEAEQVVLTVAAYRARRDALCAAAAECLSPWFEWEVPPGGMFVWMRATHPGIDTNVLYTHALAENVAFVPSSVFDPSGELRSAMRLNFTRNPPEVLADGIRRLARAVRRHLAT
jgi:2-aminoadipate transaminase